MTDKDKATDDVKKKRPRKNRKDKDADTPEDKTGETGETREETREEKKDRRQMKRRIVITPELITEMLKAYYMQSAPVSQITKKHGISPKTFKNILKEYGPEYCKKAGINTNEAKAITPDDYANWLKNQSDDSFKTI